MSRGFDHEDGSCPLCTGHAVARVNTRTGLQFWGCTNYPRCRNTMAVQSGEDFFLSRPNLDRAYAEAFYTGDG